MIKSVKTVPSTGGAGSDRIMTLVNPFDDHEDSQSVTLPPEDAAALSETYNRVTV